MSLLKAQVRWMDRDRQAIAALPEHIDLATAGPIREQLLALINRGAQTIIADMSATVSCDHAGADTLARVHQRAAASGTELRLVVTDPVIRRVLGLAGIDRLVSIYPVLEAALAARRPAVVLPLVPRAARPDGRAPVITPAVVWQALDALPDGIALTDDAGDIRLVNRRLEEMFGYQHGELPGRPLRILVPAGLDPLPGGRLTGARKDGTTFPVQVSIGPVSARTGRFTMAVIRDGTTATQDPAIQDPAAQADEMLNGITSSIFEVGVVLSAAAGLPPGDLSQRIDEAVRLLDDIVRGIYDAAFRRHDFRPGGSCH